MKLKAHARLSATQALYTPTENEVRRDKAFPAVLRLAEQLVDVQGKLKSKLARFDALQRPLVRSLVSEETGLDFSILK